MTQKKSVAPKAKAETELTVTKTENPIVVKKDQQIRELLTKLNKLENLKNYYSKLKVKQNSLKEAFDKMNKLTSQKKDHFEEGQQSDFPFEIVLKGKLEYDRMEEIFKINKRETVTRFTEFLLLQLNDLLEAFEADLIREAEKDEI